jgi:integrase
VPAYTRELKKGVRWRYVGSYLGTPYASKAIYLTKKEALAAERRKLQDLDEQARNPGDIRLSELFGHRLESLELNRNREYFEDNRRLLKQALAAWGDVKASEVTKRMAADLIMAETRRAKRLNLGNSRPNQLLKVLKASFNYANRVLGLEIRNPFAGLTRLPEDATAKFLPTELMIEAVQVRCNAKQRLLIDFADQTAARISECLNLRYEDISSDTLTLYTRKSRNSDRRPRIIPKPPCLAPLLANLDLSSLRRTNLSDRVFDSWTAYPRFLEEIVTELKQPKWNWHSLRRRRASIWAHQGKTLLEIMSLLGHTRLDTTQRYLFQIGIQKL